MPSFFFVGNEDHDFSKNGNVNVNTATTAARRTAYSRCSMAVGPISTATEGITAALTSPQSAFWFTARLYFAAGNPSYGYDFMTLRDAGGVSRLILRAASFDGHWVLYKKAANGAETQLLSGSYIASGSSIQKVDVYVNYAASGSFMVYVDNNLVFNYSGNLVTDAATTLASFTLGGSGVATHWSEVIASDADTRFMSLITLTPTANGNTFNWDAGSYASINEVTTDDATVITSGTAGQLAQFAINSAGVTGNVAIKAVCVSARAGKGVSGPQNAKMTVRAGGADYLGDPVPLSAGFVARWQSVMLTNPANGAAWTNGDLTAAGFNVGIASAA